MKDIYELLAEIDIDDQEMKEIENTVEVSELEKARVKQQLRKSLRKHRGWKGKGIVAAALVGMVVSGTAYIGITNPAYAAEIPIVGDIFRFLDNGRTGVYDLYKENANEINVTKESNGIEVTIKDAIFDGTTIAYTYEVKTNKDLGERPLIGSGPSSFDIKGYRGGMTGSNYAEKVAEGIYIGQANYSLDEEREVVQCKLNLKEILMTEPGCQETIKGKWQFAFQLEAVEGNKQVVNQQVEKDGFTVTIDHITKTPMSFIAHYSQQVPEEYRGEWDSVTTDLIVKDDLGNEYTGQGNGGGGNIDTGIMNWSATFGKLDEKATKLMITPRVYCSTMSGGVSFDEKGNEIELTKPTDAKEDREFFMEEIVIDLE